MEGYRRGILQEGRFGWCGRSGMMLSEGYFWGRRMGGYNFYVGRGSLNAVDCEHPVGGCGSSGESAEVGGAFEANTDYWIAIRAVSGFGLESAGYEWIHVRTDGEGRGHLVPDSVLSLRGDCDRRRTPRIMWEYESRMSSVLPAMFDVYVALWDHPMPYGSPIAQVPYREGRRSYFWDATMVDGPVKVKVAVRARTAEGVDDGSEGIIVVRGNSGYPGEVDSFDVEQVKR